MKTIFFPLPDGDSGWRRVLCLRTRTSFSITSALLLGVIGMNIGLFRSCLLGHFEHQGLQIMSYNRTGLNLALFSTKMKQDYHFINLVIAYRLQIMSYIHSLIWIQWPGFGIVQYKRSAGSECCIFKTPFIIHISVFY